MGVCMPSGEWANIRTSWRSSQNISADNGLHSQNILSNVFVHLLHSAHLQASARSHAVITALHICIYVVYAASPSDRRCCTMLSIALGPTLYFLSVLQDHTSVQPQTECGLCCGYHTCLPDGGLIWHRLQPGAH